MDNGSREVISSASVDDFTRAVESYRVEPSEWKLNELISHFFTPIAKHWAFKISLNVEDNEEATNDILMHMVEKALPEDERRARSNSPIRKLPVAGYCASKGSAEAAFSKIAKHKAMDIIKSRCRRWKKEYELRKLLIEDGELATAADQTDVAEDWAAPGDPL